MLPVVTEALAEPAATQRDDGVAAADRPVHTGSLEPGTDGQLAAGLHHAGLRQSQANLRHGKKVETELNTSGSIC